MKISLRQEVAHTVTTAGEIEDELRHFDCRAARLSNLTDNS